MVKDIPPPGATLDVISSMLDEDKESEVRYDEVYKLGEYINEGEFGVVHKCNHLSNSEKLYAVKVVDRVYESHEEAARIEVSILSELKDVPHVVRLVDYYVDKDNMFIVQAYADGGDVFDRLMEKENYSEKEARMLSRGLLETMEMLHKTPCGKGAGLIHRDLKPENLLLKYKHDDTQFLLCDFGNAKHLPDDGTGLWTFCGTPAYTAPEILEGVEYFESVDLWSVGVVTFNLLSGYLPFGDSDSVQSELFENICAGAYDFDDPIWDSISKEAIDFIKSLLIVDTNDRWTTQQALKCAWMDDKDETAPLVSPVSVKETLPSSTVSALPKPPSSQQGTTETTETTEIVEETTESVEQWTETEEELTETVEKPTETVQESKNLEEKPQQKRKKTPTRQKSTLATENEPVMARRAGRKKSKDSLDFPPPPTAVAPTTTTGNKLLERKQSRRKVATRQKSNLATEQEPQLPRRGGKKPKDSTIAGAPSLPPAAAKKPLERKESRRKPATRQKSNLATEHDQTSVRRGRKKSKDNVFPTTVQQPEKEHQETEQPMKKKFPQSPRRTTSRQKSYKATHPELFTKKAKESNPQIPPRQSIRSQSQIYVPDISEVDDETDRSTTCEDSLVPAPMLPKRDDDCNRSFPHEDSFVPAPLLTKVKRAKPQALATDKAKPYKPTYAEKVIDNSTNTGITPNTSSKANANQTTTECYTMEQLYSRSVPGLDYDDVQKYLSDEDFKTVFKNATREEVKTWSTWKTKQKFKDAIQNTENKKPTKISNNAVDSKNTENNKKPTKISNNVVESKNTENNNKKPTKISNNVISPKDTENEKKPTKISNNVVETKVDKKLDISWSENTSVGKDRAFKTSDSFLSGTAPLSTSSHVSNTSSSSSSSLTSVSSANDSEHFTLEQLFTRSVSGLDYDNAKLENYLSDEDFKGVFQSVSREQVAKWPRWRVTRHLKDAYHRMRADSKTGASAFKRFSGGNRSALSTSDHCPASAAFGNKTSLSKSEHSSSLASKFPRRASLPSSCDGDFNARTESMSAPVRNSLMPGAESLLAANAASKVSNNPFVKASKGKVGNRLAKNETKTTALQEADEQPCPTPGSSRCSVHKSEKSVNTLDASSSHSKIDGIKTNDVKVLSGTAKCYTLQELHSRTVPGLDYDNDHLESYLSEEDFKMVFANATREEVATWKLWKVKQKLRDAFFRSKSSGNTISPRPNFPYSPKKIEDKSSFLPSSAPWRNSRTVTPTSTPLSASRSSPFKRGNKGAANMLSAIQFSSLDNDDDDKNVVSKPKEKKIPPLVNSSSNNDNNNSNGEYYPLEDLKRKSIEGLDYDKVEQYLCEEDFEKVFKTTKAEFANWKPWKVKQHKRSSGLW